MPEDIQTDWRKYRDSAYPRGMAAQQNIEVHQAFFAGALVTLGKLQEITALPEAEAMAALSKLTREVNEVCAARAQSLKGRN